MCLRRLTVDIKMSVATIAEGGTVENWADARDEILSLIDKHIADDFEKPDESFRDPLTGITTHPSDLRRELGKTLWGFDSPPFTVQRLAELALLDGCREQYPRDAPYKYLFALAHVVRVKSTLADFDEVELPNADRNDGVRLDDISWAPSP